MWRKRRKKTNRLGTMPVICIITVSVLNAIGISYGVWNDSVSINTSISTGNIEPYFCDKYQIEEVSNKPEMHLIANEISDKPKEEVATNEVRSIQENGNVVNVASNKPKGELSVNIEDKYTMNIEGKVEAGYKAFLHYFVNNGGTVPIKYDKEDKTQCDGLKLIVNQPSSKCILGDSDCNDVGETNLEIEVDKSMEGKYEFEIELYFSQWH